LTLNLVNEAKPGVHLLNLFCINVVKANKERNIVDRTLLIAVGAVMDAPFMASYHERPRPDCFAVGYLLYSKRVVFDHKQVVPTVRNGVNS
jgi:hypothetical protein